VATQSSQPFALADKKTIGTYHEPAHLHLLQAREHILEIAFGTRIQEAELYAQRASSRLQVFGLNLGYHFIRRVKEEAESSCRWNDLVKQF
jgi:hypothetical protein